MKNQDFKQKLKYEIKKRMASSNWDREIAMRVIESKKKSKKRVMYISSLSSLSFAALAFLVFIFGISDKNPSRENIYNQFVTKEVEGTYNFIINNGSGQSAGEISYVNNVDNLIDETLSMR
jgi:hypothetical protein